MTLWSTDSTEFVTIIESPLHTYPMEEATRIESCLQDCQRTEFASTTSAHKTPRADTTTWQYQYAPEMVGHAPAFLDMLEAASRSCHADCPVLITGENGTGKELLAQAFHRASRRASGPFVAVNCAAIPKELIESELFGHTKGAFTGAHTTQIGHFAMADGGTLFLDEIAEMDPKVQSKLLRVLQDHEITPVGESKPRRLDIQVIAATNRNLDQLIQDGLFREDLYYRLNVLQIHIPALRHRKEDIPLLADHFAEQLSRERRLPRIEFSSAVIKAFMTYNWPGNVRELRNAIDRLTILYRGERIDAHHLSPSMFKQTLPRAVDDLPSQDQSYRWLPKTIAPGFDLKDALETLEGSLIEQALLKSQGNKNQAAKMLGLNRTTLVEKLRKRHALTN